MSITDRIAEARAVIARSAPAGIERRTFAVGDGADYQGALTDLEVREAPEDSDAEFTISGRAAVFDDLSVDLGGFRERIKRGAFKRVLGDDVRFLVNHDPSLLVARTRSGTLRLRESPKGLEFEADAAPVQVARDLRVWVERGDMTQCSFGFRVADDEWTEEDGELIRTIHRFDALFDVSAVTYPAYPSTSIDGVRNVPSDPDELMNMAWRIHREGEDVPDTLRRAIDDGLASHGLVSPWAAERVFRAAQEEPELLAAARDLRVTVEPVEVGRDEVAAAARARSLRLRQRQLAH